MGRNQTRVGAIAGVHVPGLRRDGPRWSDPYHCDWGTVVGARLRRLRTAHGWTLAELCPRVGKPEGGHDSAGYFSRLERGWASAPLYVYLVIAERLGVNPGLLLGADELDKSLTGGQKALLRFLDRAGIEPEEAIVRLAEGASRAGDGGAPGDGGL